jgi:hypothetical protein
MLAPADYHCVLCRHYYSRLSVVLDNTVQYRLLLHAKDDAAWLASLIHLLYTFTSADSGSG